MSNRVLIIEDEHDLRALYAEILTNAGYNVDQAPDGEGGIDKIKNTSWNVLLLDIMLPGKDGLRILKEMKENPGFKKGAVIVITNLNSEHIIQEAFSLGADGYLIKSEITPDKVVDEVKEFIK
jgi:DNA-binding response OmpR family regulator